MATLVSNSAGNPLGALRSNPSISPTTKSPQTAVDHAIDAVRAAKTPVEAGAALRSLDKLTDSRVSSNALAQAAPPTGSGAVTDQCRVDVRYTSVALGANHALIVTTDSDSTNFFRGGPSAEGPGSGSSGPLGSASGGSSGGSSRSGSSNGSNSSNGSSPGSGRGGPSANNGPWGPIIMTQGAYRPGTIDWTTSPGGQQVAQIKPGNCDAIESQFSRHANDIQRASIPYNPLSTNSNATVREILERSAVPIPQPVVWAPGWNTQLPMPR
jgi:hypothetical protein